MLRNVKSMLHLKMVFDNIIIIRNKYQLKFLMSFCIYLHNDTSLLNIELEYRSVLVWFYLLSRLLLVFVIPVQMPVPMVWKGIRWKPSTNPHTTFVQH